MANILKKQFKDFPIGTQVKIHGVDTGITTISVPPATKQYMLPSSYIVSSTVANHSKPDWTKLDTMPINYPCVRVQCFCGKVVSYYNPAYLAIHTNEHNALIEAQSNCLVCSDITKTVRYENATEN